MPFTRCVPCSREFATASSLKRHNRRVHEAKPQPICEWCGEKFLRLVDVANHRSQCRVARPTVAVALVEERPFRDFRLWLALPATKSTKRVAVLTEGQWRPILQHVRLLLKLSGTGSLGELAESEEAMGRALCRVQASGAGPARMYQLALTLTKICQHVGASTTSWVDAQRHHYHSLRPSSS